MTCIKTGARVHFVDYGQTLPADLFQINDAILVHVNIQYALDTNQGTIDSSRATHEVKSVFGGGNEFWRDDLGVFVVPIENVKFL